MVRSVIKTMMLMMDKPEVAYSHVLGHISLKTDAHRIYKRHLATSLVFWKGTEDLSRKYFAVHCQVGQEEV